MPCHIPVRIELIVLHLSSIFILFVENQLIAAFVLILDRRELFDGSVWVYLLFFAFGVEVHLGLSPVLFLAAFVHVLLDFCETKTTKGKSNEIG